MLYGFVSAASQAPPRSTPPASAGSGLPARRPTMKPGNSTHHGPRRYRQIRANQPTISATSQKAVAALLPNGTNGRLSSKVGGQPAKATPVGDTTAQGSLPEIQALVAE